MFAKAKKLKFPTAVDGDLQVSGITGTPYSAANGKYYIQAVSANVNGYRCWVHERGDYNIHCAIYSGVYYWHIDALHST